MQRHSVPGRALAALLSLVLPGLGQLWREQTVRGALVGAGVLLGWLALVALVYLGSAASELLVLGAAGHVAAAVDAAWLDEQAAQRRSEQRSERRRGRQRGRRRGRQRPNLP